MELSRTCNVLNNALNSLVTRDRRTTSDIQQEAAERGANDDSSVLESRLHQDLYRSMWHGTILLEQTERVLQRIDENLPETDIEKKLFAEGLNELKKRAHEYYVSLDILATLYNNAVIGPIDNPQQAEESEVREENNEEAASAPRDRLELVDERVDLIDEEYEAYVTNDDDDDSARGNEEVQNNYDHETNENHQRMSLLNRELDQHLRTNDRFVQARRRFNIVDQESITENNANRKESNSTHTQTDIDEPQPSCSYSTRSAVPPRPPPPPPILPPSLEASFYDMPPVRSIAESIRANSSVRPVSETIIGDASDSDD